MRLALSISLVLWACIIFSAKAFAWHDDKQIAFDRPESIDYHKSWCSSTVDYFIRFDDAAKEQEKFAISKAHVEDYVLFTATAESLHAELADRCFYPVQ